MATPRVDAARELAAELVGLGVPATVDPGEAARTKPCVLVAPPTLDYSAGSYSAPQTAWRLLVLAAGAGTLDAWDQLDSLLDQLETHVPLDRAEPGAYQLGAELVACYVATWTD